MSKPKEIRALEKIYKITLTEVSIDEFWSAAHNSYVRNDRKEVTHLDLSRNGLTEIKGLETLTQLETLDLSYNQLTEIKGLETLTQLQDLDVNNNQIKELPVWITN
jgi:Leucine-rich repeat (LRR) protein